MEEAIQTALRSESSIPDFSLFDKPHSQQLDRAKVKKNPFTERLQELSREAVNSVAAKEQIKVFYTRNSGDKIEDGNWEQIFDVLPKVKEMLQSDPNKFRKNINDILSDSVKTDNVILAILQQKGITDQSI